MDTPPTSGPPQPSLHVIVGAGPIGSAVAEELAGAGHPVRIVTRSGSGPVHPGIERITADAADSAGLCDIAAGAAAIYNCANPPYHRWSVDWPPLAASLVVTAEQTGAVLATASNLYGYGPVAEPMRPDMPLRTTSKKGKIRARMWNDALAAHDEGRIRTVEVRGSDYIGPGAQSHLGGRVIPKLLTGRKVSVLGSADQAHSWTYTRDMAHALVATAVNPQAWGRAWHAPSNPPRTQREAIDDLARVAGVAPIAVGTVPALALRLLGLANPVMRELPEMMYQFTAPFVLDDSETRQLLGLQPTPWDEVLAATLASFGAQVSRVGG